MKRFALIPLLLALALPPGCAEATRTLDEVLSFIEATEAASREYVFRLDDEDMDEEVEAVGVVEDSFRHRVLLRLGGIDVVEQVVDDDALAVRVINPDKVPAIAQGFAPASQVVLDTLRAGEWVVDPSAAPPIELRRDEEVPAGQDALLLAANVLRHVRVAVNEAVAVQEWQEEALTPAYRPSEDNFPPADRDEGERRFDLVRPPIPRPGREVGALEAEMQTAMFRKMAIYVRDDLIVKVLEEVDIAGHRDFVDARALERERMMAYLEEIKSLTGTQRIVERTMSVEFRNFGREGSIRQPPDALRASLRGIFGSVGSPQEEELPFDIPAMPDAIPADGEAGEPVLPGP